MVAHYLNPIKSITIQQNYHTLLKHQEYANMLDIEVIMLIYICILRRRKNKGFSLAAWAMSTKQNWRQLDIFTWNTFSLSDPGSVFSWSSVLASLMSLSSGSEASLSVVSWSESSEAWGRNNLWIYVTGSFYEVCDNLSHRCISNTKPINSDRRIHMDNLASSQLGPVIPIWLSRLNLWERGDPSSNFTALGYHHTELNRRSQDANERSDLHLILGNKFFCNSLHDRSKQN